MGHQSASRRAVRWQGSRRSAKQALRVPLPVCRAHADGFRTFYGTVLKAFAAIDTNSQQALEAEIIGLIERFNTVEDGTAVIHSEYLEIVISKQG